MTTPERAARISQVASQRQHGVVVLEDVHDPHNAAAVFRSCDAFGIQQVHLVFCQESPYNPRKIGRESSSSANKWLDFALHRSIESCLTELHEAGFESVAMVLDGTEETLFDTKFPKARTAFLIGNEHRGLSPTAVRLAHRRVSIPMLGMVESLNLSVTASLCLFEMTRQRNVAGMAEFRFSAEECEALAADFRERGSRRRRR